MNTVCRSSLPPQVIARPRSAPIVVWTGIARILGVSGAACCIVLATLGVFLPVLPTTPFVLLASYLLCRSFPEVHQRFRNTRPVGRLLTDWEERGGIRANDKLRAIVVLLVCSCGTLYAGNLSQTLVVLFLIVIAVGLTVILRLPMVRDPDGS
ncbi:MAG: YbaN family protein [Planctomycetaceae bacterium]|nr:YbaN family protein [Planctomycetaceae bacterium]